ncbi:hypothetical protein L1049_020849 [Liquidambar formosana]|uniref:Agenet domain-containing protein n=1 Tax=Liquidambar formosana TaxID=63359 RepID=A0AAP0XA77_LIQFO
MVRVGGDLYKRGSVVEVGSNEEGFKDAWYVATILKPPWKSSTSRRKNRALVQYQTLVTEEDSQESKPLTEYVDAALLRPLPPEEIQPSFEPNDVVDAYHRDGWWTGVIARVVVPNRRYSVFFLNPPEEIEFDVSDLRVRFEWSRGKWVRSEKQMTTGLFFSTGTQVEVNLDKETSGDVWFPATFLIEVGINSFLVQYQSSKHGDEAECQTATVDCLHIRPSPPCLEDNNFELFDKVDAFYDFGWRVGMITKVLIGRRYGVTLMHSNEEKELGQSEIRPHLEWTGIKWVSNSRQKEEGMNSHRTREEQPPKVLVKSSKASAAGKEHNGAVGATVEINQQKEEGMSSRRKRKERPPKGLVKSPKASAAGKEHNGAVGTTVEMVVEDCAEFPATTGVEFTGMKDSQAELLFPFSGKKNLKRIRYTKLLNEPAGHMNTEINQHRGGMSSQMIRKRRTPKVLSKRPKASTAGKEHNGAVGTAVEMVVKDCTELPIMTEAESIGRRGSQPGISFQLPTKEHLKCIRYETLLNEPARHKNILSNVTRMRLAKKVKLPNEIVRQVLGKHFEKHSAESGRKQSITINTEPPTQAPQEAPGEEVLENYKRDRVKKDVPMIIAEMSSTMADDDQPLLTWFEGMHSSTVADDSRLFIGKADKQLNEARERQVEIGSEPNKNQILPFVKSSPVWKTIESMEVFQKMPQKPHFRPLDGCKEECREGLAVGNMVTFVNLVERMSKLQFDDSRSVFDSSLEALHDLETHGFDIKALEGRFNELLSIKNRLGQLEDQSKQVEGQIIECTQEETNIDRKIDEIDKKILELQEKRALVMSRKEIKESEVATLQKTVNVINEGIRSAQLEFERLTAVPW